MAYDINERVYLINTLKDKLSACKNILARPTAIENQLSSLCVQLSKNGDAFYFGNISILHVTDIDGGASDRRKKASITTLTNDTVQIFFEEDTTYFYNGYLYSVPMTFSDGNYPYYTTKTGTVVSTIPKNTLTRSSYYSNYIITDDANILSVTDSIKLRDGMRVLLDDMLYFTSERDTTGTIIKVSNEAVLSIKGLVNYIDVYLDNLDEELVALNANSEVTTIEESVAELFELKTNFSSQNTRYAGMVGEMWVGFGLIVENQDLQGIMPNNMQIADVSKLDNAYVSWRNIVNKETLYYSYPATGGDDDSGPSGFYYDIYRLDYEKCMALSARSLIPILFLFLTLDIQEVKHCEYDEVVIFILMIVAIVTGAHQVAAALGSTWAFAYIVLSIIAMSGEGSDDFQLAVKLSLLAIGGYAGWKEMVKSNFATMDVLLFSLNMSNGMFEAFSTYDLNKREKENEKLANEYQDLQEAWDLAQTQDKALDYIYNYQYDELYDTMFDSMYDTNNYSMY